MTFPAYFDNAATTPLDPRVLDAMMPYVGLAPGNPSSMHLPGRRARAAVEHAREQVAELIGARAGEIVFTGSGTEADDLAVLGTCLSAGRAAGSVVTSAIEHPAVLEPCRALERLGGQVHYAPVNGDGVLTSESLAECTRAGTRLVSVMAANNVVGTLQPTRELAAVAHERGALFHVDAVQAVGKIPFDVGSMGIDLASLSAHKIHGPQGVGALYVRAGVRLEPLLFGGGQERGLRPGTEGVAGIVGLGAAAEIARRERTTEAVRLVGLRDRIIDGLSEHVPNVYLVGDRYHRLPGHVCVGFAGQEAEAVKLLLALDELGIAVSSGSACSSRHAGEPSHVLTAMGFDPVAARGSLRITLGRFTTDEEVDRLLSVLPAVAAGLRPIASRTA